MTQGFKWIGLIIATMVGAGYATGREIWEFFGPESSLAILLFTVLFTISCHLILEVAHHNKSKHYMPVLSQFVGSKSAKLYDGFILLYLFTTLFVMIAGSGATLTFFSWTHVFGILVTVFFIVIVIPRGMNGFLSVNRFLTPMLIVGLFVVLVLFIFRENVPVLSEPLKQSNWVQSIPFTSLNVLPLLAVLSAIGSEIKSKKEIYVASIGSGLILGAISFVYNTSLVHVSEQLFFIEVPLFAILNGYPIEIFLIMTLLLWFAIYTTALASIFGIISRLQSVLTVRKTWIGLVIIVLALPFSFLKFSTLISYLYPFYGVINLYVLAAILLFPIVKRATAYKI